MGREETLRDFFHEYSGRFDRIYAPDASIRGSLDRIFRRSMYERFEYVLKAYKEIAGGTVLDVGCGSGRYAVALALMGTKRVVGVDVAEGMLDMARQSAEEAGVADRCEFVLGDFESVDLGEKFDYSIAMGLFDYIAEPEQFTRSMLAITNKRMIASFPRFSLLRSPQRRLRYSLIHHCPVYFYRPKSLTQMLKNAGGENFQLIQLPGGPGADMLVDLKVS
jgi:SAM-dependent methyltransferase